MKKSDVAKLKREVLDFGPEAALPQHLSDIWLTLLSRDLNFVLDTQGNDDSFLLAPLAIIAHILMGKGDGQHASFTEGELVRCLYELRKEVNCEMLRRRAYLDLKPAATLETIFAN